LVAVRLVTSRPLLAELRRVLAYPKLAKAIPDGPRLADLVEMASVVVEPIDAFAVVEDERGPAEAGRRGTVRSCDASVARLCR
jgi:predicted nucleic acid-binding protein